MSLLQLRRGAMASHPVGRILLLLAVVCAIMIGLLAMHTIASATPGHTEPAAASMAIGGQETATGSLHAAGSECVECGSAHDMTAMACILALLVGLLLVGGSRQRLSALFPRNAALFRALLAHAAVSVVPPPDLNRLSISRT